MIENTLAFVCRMIPNATRFQPARDQSDSTEAHIDYRRYDGKHFPAPDKSVDAVLLCYVLHHAQDVRQVLTEVRGVLREGGLVIIYEDIRASWWDKGVCWIHNQQWRARTGPCTFRGDSAWRGLFESLGFEIVTERSMSRWRNLTHPVARRLYLLELSFDSGIPGQRQFEPGNNFL
jgi:ubiquinone/menaquinone biosynthesis C-methylase UbiE